MLEQLTEERAATFGDERADECRIYLGHFREHEDAAGLLPPSFEPLVREIFGPLAARREARTAAAVVERHRLAVLISCKNGAATIGETVRSALGQADVYVVSDGSTDEVVDEAIRAGARAITRYASLAATYEYIAVIDDDTVIEPGYLDRLVARMDADAEVAVVRRWSPLTGVRDLVHRSLRTAARHGHGALSALKKPPSDDRGPAERAGLSVQRPVEWVDGDRGVLDELGHGAQQGVAGALVGGW